MQLKKTILSVVVIITLFLVPLFVLKNTEFVGTDDKAVSTVMSIDSNYKPWITSMKLSDSPEIASTLFALQAALGASVIAYYVGYSKGKKVNKNA